MPPVGVLYCKAEPERRSTGKIELIGGPNRPRAEASIAGPERGDGPLAT